MKALLDSNIVIYSLMPEHAVLRKRLKQFDLHISDITIL
jgi:predicted nucleic acid-binding protein